MGAQQNSISGTRAFWIGSDEQTMERTATAWSSLFKFTFLRRLDELTLELDVSDSRGTFIVLELCDSDTGKSSSENIERWSQCVSDLNHRFDMPVILCLGDMVPAQIVVDWIRGGLFTYLERRANIEKYRQTLIDCRDRAHRIAEQFCRYDLLLQRWNSVTDREAVVLEMLLDGTPNKTIATRLGVSQRTVETRRHNLYEKLDSRCVAEVVKVMYELEALSKFFRRVDALNHEKNLQPNFLKAGTRPIPVVARESSLLQPVAIEE